jgi:hypothetical protein
VCTVVVTSEPIEPAEASRQIAGVADAEMSVQRSPDRPMTITGRLGRAGMARLVALAAWVVRVAPAVLAVLAARAARAGAMAAEVGRAIRLAAAVTAVALPIQVRITCQRYRPHQVPGSGDA